MIRLILYNKRHWVSNIKNIYAYYMKQGYNSNGGFIVNDDENEDEELDIAEYNSKMSIEKYIETDYYIVDIRSRINTPLYLELKKYILEYYEMIYALEKYTINKTIRQSIFIRNRIELDTMNSIETTTKIDTTFSRMMYDFLSYNDKMRIKTHNLKYKDMLRRPGNDQRIKIAITEKNYELRPAIMEGHTEMAHLVPSGVMNIFWHLNKHNIPKELTKLSVELRKKTMAWNASKIYNNKSDSMLTRHNSLLPFMFIRVLFTLTDKYKPKNIIKLLQILINSLFKTMISYNTIYRLWNTTTEQGQRLDKLKLDFSKNIRTLEHELQLSTQPTAPKSGLNLLLSLKNKSQTVPQNLFEIVYNLVDNLVDKIVNTSSYTYWTYNGMGTLYPTKTLFEKANHISYQFSTHLINKTDKILLELENFDNFISKIQDGLPKEAVALRNSFTPLHKTTLSRVNSTGKRSNTYKRMSSIKNTDVLQRYISTNPKGIKYVLQFIEYISNMSEQITLTELSLIFKYELSKKTYNIKHIPSMTNTLNKVVKIIGGEHTTTLNPQIFFKPFRTDYANRSPLSNEENIDVSIVNAPKKYGAPANEEQHKTWTHGQLKPQIGNHFKFTKPNRSRKRNSPTDLPSKKTRT